MGGEPGVATTLEDGLLVLHIRRPDKRNALTEAMYADLAAGLGRAASEARARAIVVRGEPGVFTSGNDIVDFLERPPIGESSPVSRFLRALSTAAKPIVAGVQGPAVGIGTTMLLHCDHVVAGESAQFAVPFVNLGVCPEAASSVLLAATIGYKRAAQMLLFGERVDARRALEWGLVNAVVPDAQVDALARERAATLASRPAQSLRTTKDLLKRRLAPLVAQAMADEAREFARLLRTPAAREMLEAFAGKRAPDAAKID